jgi:IclR family transcriptional regulator, acetate operon repressor
MGNGDGSAVRSVSRAVSILELLADEGELGVTELGRRLGVHKATASRLVSTLGDHGLVERNPATEKVRLGLGLMYLAGAAVAGVDLVQHARPILEELAERTQETVTLGVLDRDQVVYVDQVAGSRAIVAVNWVGRRTPLHASASGKVLLAGLAGADRERLLSGSFEPRTDRTILDRDVLRRQLTEVLAKGFAQTIEELEEGLNAVAAPVRRGDGEIVAALSVSGPAFRLPPIEVPRVALMTRDAAEAISRRLGFSERRRSLA